MCLGYVCAVDVALEAAVFIVISTSSSDCNLLTFEEVIEVFDQIFAGRGMSDEDDLTLGVDDGGVRDASDAPVFVTGALTISSVIVFD